MKSSPMRIIENEAEHKSERKDNMRSMQLACPVTMQRYEKGKLRFKDGLIAEESDLSVRVNGKDRALLTRTPGDDQALVVGHLLTRSIIRESADVTHCSFCYRNRSRADITLNAPSGIRRLYPSPRPFHVTPLTLFDFKATFERRQNLYKNTRSTHAAALFSKEGDLIAFGEDVGRHNALDKAIGRALLEGTLDNASIAMMSSRIALELVSKITTANIPILCGFSAATSSAVNFAERNNITLVGRIRENTFDVYSNSWRIRPEKTSLI